MCVCVHIYRQIRVTKQFHVNVFGLREESRIPGENQQRSGWVSKLQHSCGKVILLTTAAPWDKPSTEMIFFINNQWCCAVSALYCNHRFLCPPSSVHFSSSVPENHIYLFYVISGKHTYYIHALLMKSIHNCKHKCLHVKKTCFVKEFNKYPCSKIYILFIVVCQTTLESWEYTNTHDRKKHYAMLYIMTINILLCSFVCIFDMDVDGSVWQ